MTTTAPIAELEQRIMRAVESTKPGKARRNALDAIRWRIRTSDCLYIGIEGVETVLCHDGDSHISIFTGCDNHLLKLAFFHALLKQPVSLVLV